MSSITAIGANHAKILTGLRDSRLCNKLAKSKSKNGSTRYRFGKMSQIWLLTLRDPLGYSPSTLDVNLITSSNNYSSVNSHRSTKPPTRGIQQPLVKLDKPKCWHCQGVHLKKDFPTAPHQSSSSNTKYKLTKERQHNLIKSFCKKFQDRKSQVNEIFIPSEDESFKELNTFFSEFKSMMAKDSYDTSA